MKAPDLKTGLLLTLLALAGCGSSGPPEQVTEGRRALRFLERGQYEECVKAFREWLLLYDRDYPNDGACARFFIGLSYRKMGEIDLARATFLDMCRRYAHVRDTERAAEWRQWAAEELDRLGK